MDTCKIMDLALKLAGIEELPCDSGIMVPGDHIQSVLMGVDMGTPELLLAKEMKVDLVISHHPQGGEPSIHFHQVLDRQIDCMVKAGVPINKAQKALKERQARIERDSHVSNYDRNQSAAVLMGIPYMNIHMPLDIITEKFVQNHLDASITNPRATLKEVVEALMEVKEYQNALAKPAIRVGTDADFAGKVLVLMAGGTNGGEAVFKAYFEAGVGTIVCMHVPEEVRKAVADQNIGNIVVAGHMASDSIGINIFIRNLQEQGLTVTTMSGIVPNV